jgi:hypothetical protein
LSVGKVKVQIPKQWITMKKNNYWDFLKIKIWIIY